MKESELFLSFIKKFFLILFLPSLVGLLIGVSLFSTQPSKTKISQSFKFIYSLDNLGDAAPLVDQAVVEMRLQGLEREFSDTKVTIYKSAQFAIAIDVLSNDKETGFKLMVKESEYLRQNFSVSAINQPQIETIDPNFLKYILTGTLIGFLIGLLLSLGREYMRNY